MWPANSHCFNRVRVGGCACGTHSALEGTSPRKARLPIRTGATYLFIYYRQLPHIPLFYFILSTITLGTHLKLSVSLGFLPLTGSCFPRFLFFFQLRSLTS